MDCPKPLRRVVDRLGEDMTFTPVAGGAQSFRGLFASPYVELLPGGVGVASANPRVGFMTGDLTGTLYAGTVTRSSVTYKVMGVEPDAPSGLTELQLEKQ